MLSVFTLGVFATASLISNGERNIFTYSQFKLTSETVLASCECGYSVNSTTDEKHAVFTDLHETDFLHISDLNTPTGWRPQDYKVSPRDARGPYGKSFSIANVIPNPMKNNYDWAGESARGGDAGLQLWVRSKVQTVNVGSAELAGDRQDMLYGSFRVAMKMSRYSGTCGAFFWYSTDTQEIDMEFLSKEFSDDKNTVNYVLQTPESAAMGFDASRTPYFKPLPLRFRPDQAFHEYRFDWTPHKVSFYVDGNWQYDMNQGVPSSPGHLVLNHWSNGDGNWSAGPPELSTIMTISYVKAYFNSSSSDRQIVYQKSCPVVDSSKICRIPTLSATPDNTGPNANDTAHTYFFTQDRGELGNDDHAPNQIVYDSSAVGVRWLSQKATGSLPNTVVTLIATAMYFVILV
ncbi:concanavalin A-like lectin/glucanase [Pseudovirgaria hyperparasitica]|uniref:Concanavalin A-like lectin/glucanase n=1 Tax=Pseudovirgaria hyperparasitica TaxID=470096 RepID=A0A6A6WL02_9PEZI|nr:concanavalin A-like lectin/glucanase [Pseudovirgaria hyperparasitica]KAF2762856.1 concanavalin A-like lectin/glucanase [Pseudovirgaria hyperparasitica]